MIEFCFGFVSELLRRELLVGVVCRVRWELLVGELGAAFPGLDHSVVQFVFWGWITRSSNLCSVS